MLRPRSSTVLSFASPRVARAGVVILVWLAGWAAVPAPAEEPGGLHVSAAEGEAVRRALAAFATGDEAILQRLAEADEPDPWIVADLLQARGAGAAALALAHASARKDLAALPAYLEAVRGSEDAASARRTLVDVYAAFAARDAKEGLRLAASVASPGAHVPGVRVRMARGMALEALGRNEEAAKVYLEVADAAEGIEWLQHTSAGLEFAATAAVAASDFRGAVAALRRQVLLERRRGTPAGEASALGNLGTALIELGSFDEALTYHEQSLALEERLGNRHGAAVSRLNVANIQIHRGRPWAAAAVLEKAAQSFRELGDAAGLTSALGNHGQALMELGDVAGAVPLFHRALELAEAQRNHNEAARLVVALAVAEWRFGRFEAAERLLRRSLEAFERVGNPQGKAKALGNLAEVHLSKGEYGRALEYAEASFEISTSLGDRLSASLGNLVIGNVYSNLGDLDRALIYLERALKEQEDIGAFAAVTSTLGTLATVRYERGDYAGTEELLRQVLARYETSKDRRRAAVTLGNLGNLFEARREYAAALDAHRRSLAEMESVGHRAGASLARMHVGCVLAQQGKEDEGSAEVVKAAEAAEEIGDLDTLAVCLENLASLHLAAGRFPQALSTARRAVALLPVLVAGQGDQTASLARERFSSPFEVGAHAATELGQQGDVVSFLEGGRAGALLEALGGRFALRGAALPPAWVQAEVEARSKEARARARLDAAMATRAPEATRSARAELRSARRELGDLVARLQRDAKAAADLVYPRPDPAEVIRERLADDEAVVLYGLFERGAIAAVLTSGGTRVVRLGASQPILEASQALADPRVGPLADGARGPRSPLPLPDPTPDGAATADLDALVTRLRALVIEPLELDERVRRLLISPAGELTYVPFSLLSPSHEVVCVPSATTHGLLLAKAEEEGQDVLAFGDVDYTARGGSRGLVRLEGSRREVEAIGDVVVVGSDATVARFRTALGRKQRWRAVHLACHGLVDTEQPLLSSLALSPGEHDDGRLRVLDLYRLDLSADLAVLSACETGRGRFIRSEGLVGLVRGFMLAGCPRVVCSLWKVDDDATSALMTRFYELWNPGRGKEGLGAADALRKAQAWVASHEEWKHPHYWAAWVLWGLPD